MNGNPPASLSPDQKIAASPRQQKFLAALSKDEWRRTPPGTLGPTIVALLNRGIIEARMVNITAHRYADAYEWRLT